MARINDESDSVINPPENISKRSDRSVQALLYRAGNLLLEKRGGLTREQMCAELNVDKRRLSAALSTTTAVGLLVEPENCRPGTAEKPLIRLRMPGLALVRNLRLEAICTEILKFEEFYWFCVEFRKVLE